MTKVNILTRFFGAIIFGWGLYWFWSSEFTLVTVYHIPLPMQFIFILFGLLLLLIPAPFLTILTVFLPKEKAKDLTEFINSNFNVKQNNPVIQPSDTGQVLADKLNEIIFLTKRRFYIGFVIVLVIFPLIALYIWGIKSSEKANLIRESDLIIKVVQSNPLRFDRADKYREVLAQTPNIKKISPDDSSSAKIHKILDQLYNENVADEHSFEVVLKNIYSEEVEKILLSNDFDFKKIKTPISDIDPKEAKEALYLLLATMCNIRGENGSYMLPLLYARGILNEIKSKPNVYYHVSGWNYGGLLKSLCYRKFDEHEKIANIVFLNNVPTKLVLATNALSEYKEYSKSENTLLAKLRYENNFVDINIPIIWILRVNGENFQANTPEEKEILSLKTADPVKLFQDLHKHLETAKKLDQDSVIETTKAQLYSLEGEVKTTERKNNLVPQDQICFEERNGSKINWCQEQRKLALDSIKQAVSSNRSKSPFMESEKQESFFRWLWEDESTAKELRNITSSN